MYSVKRSPCVQIHMVSSSEPWWPKIDLCCFNINISHLTFFFHINHNWEIFDLQKWEDGLISIFTYPFHLEGVVDIW